MKLIIFSSDFPPKDGGVSNYAFEVAKAFKNNKLLDQVLTYTGKSCIEGYYIRYSTIAPLDRKLLKRFGDSISIIRRINTFFHYLYIIFLSIIEWQKLQARKKYVIAISCYGYKQALQIRALSLIGVKYSLVLHGLDIIDNQKQIKNLFDTVCSEANKIILNSNATKNLFLEYYPSLKSKCFIQYPILDVDAIKGITFLGRTELSKRFSIDLENKLICFSISRLIKRKGIDIAIRVICDLHQAHKELCFLIGGKGEEMNSLNGLIIKNNAQSYIKLVDFITEQEKFSILNESSIFLMPTNSQGKTDFEGFGISFIEASLLSNVVIGGVHGGVKEAIQNERTGYTIDFDLSSGENILFEKLHILLNDSDLRYHISNNGKEYVLENFISLNKSLFINSNINK